MTEQEFRKNQALRDQLNDLLKHPALRQALEIIEDEAKPRANIQPVPGAAFDTVVAKSYHRHSGIQRAVDRLKQMAIPWSQESPEEETEQPAISIADMIAAQPPEIQERLKAYQK